MLYKYTKQWLQFKFYKTQKLRKLYKKITEIVFMILLHSIVEVILNNKKVKNI